LIDLLRVISFGSGTGMGTGSKAGIGSEIFFFLVILETSIRGERPLIKDLLFVVVYSSSIK
jgi:hypothetical protein